MWRMIFAFSASLMEQSAFRANGGTARTELVSRSGVRGAVSIGTWLLRRCVAACNRDSATPERYAIRVPCCMFTFHGYGTWWPDHPRGYVRKNEGVLPPDPDMGEQYRDNAKFDVLRFDRAKQQVIVDAVREVCERSGVRLHYAVAVSTHAHAVVSW